MLEDALGSLNAIVEGAGPVVHIIVTPGCSKGGELWNASRQTADRLQYRWLPFGFGIDTDVAHVARAFDLGTSAAVQALLLGSDDDVTPSAEGMARARLQDLAFEDQVGRLLWESTGMAPATPTLGFAVVGGGFRVVRGSIDSERFEEIARLSSS